MEREVKTLSILLESPKHPLTVIIGGAKISDKVDAIHNLLARADTILVGGAVANVFLKAQGKVLGSSFIEDVFVDKAKREKKDWVEDAQQILREAENLGKKILCPTDLVISNTVSIDMPTRIINIQREKVPPEWSALDIGPETQKEFSAVIGQSKIVFINGPMGKFEDKKFSQGSEVIFNAIKNIKKDSLGETIVAGGDTIDAARAYGSLEDYSYVSLAGGATLEFLAGKELPALTLLTEEQ